MTNEDESKLEDESEALLEDDELDAENLEDDVDDLEAESEGEDEEAVIPPGLSGEEELEEIYEQRGGGEAQRTAEALRPVDDRFQGRRQGGDGRMASADQLFCEAIPRRAGQYGERLHGALRGKLLVTMTESSKAFLVDWSGDALKSEACADASLCEHDCRISIKESDLIAVANGELNPQIGMLSHKINVSGRSDLAVYFFNLLAF